MRNHRTQLLLVVMLAGMMLWLTSPSSSEAGANGSWGTLSDETRYYAGLSGSGVGNGVAEYRETSSRRRLDVSASSITLASGTVLSVRVNGNAVDNMTVDSFANASLSLDTNNGNTVPTIAVGNTVQVLQGTTVVASGTFSTTPPPSPSPGGSPGASPSPSPSGSPGATPSPSPSGSPGATPSPSPSSTPGGELTAPLTGPAIGGITPTGRGKYETSGIPDSGDFTVRVDDVNLPAGTVLRVILNGNLSGTFTLRSSGRGEFRLYYGVAPLITPGMTLAINQGSTTILSGVFGAEPGPSPSPSPSGSPGPSPSPSPSGTPSPSPSPSPNSGVCTMSLSSATYSVNEGAGSLTVTVNRTCAQDGTSRVEFETEDGNGTANERTDYTKASGRFEFAAGELSKTFSVLITNDSFVENAETFFVMLEDPRGGNLAAPSTATVTIVDNDTAPPTSNPLEQAQFFVGQHYADFLSRTPDAGGQAYWTEQIAQCNGNEACIRSRRIGVSTAFFVEGEFQETGNFVYRLYRAALGRRPGYAEFAPDRARIVGGTSLEQSKAAYADDFTLRPAFMAEYPANWIPEQFVGHLFDQAGLIGFTTERQAEINSMYAGRTRAQVLRNVAEIQAFRTREYNSAFVLMQYYGYLRRDADNDGFQFWLGILNQQPANARGMVCAFITSLEMQTRFSSIAPRGNDECSGQP